MMKKMQLHAILLSLFATSFAYSMNPVQTDNDEVSLSAKALKVRTDEDRNIRNLLHGCLLAGQTTIVATQGAFSYLDDSQKVEWKALAFAETQLEGLLWNNCTNLSDDEIDSKMIGERLFGLSMSLYFTGAATSTIAASGLAGVTAFAPVILPLFVSGYIASSIVTIVGQSQWFKMTPEERIKFLDRLIQSKSQSSISSSSSVSGVAAGLGETIPMADAVYAPVAPMAAAVYAGSIAAAAA